MVTIEKLKGGYTYQEGAYKLQEVITTTDELFRRLLLHLEGRVPSFEGDMFGEVKIFRSKSDAVCISSSDHFREMGELRKVNEAQAETIRELKSDNSSRYSLTPKEDIESTYRQVIGLNAYDERNWTKVFADICIAWYEDDYASDDPAHHSDEDYMQQIYDIYLSMVGDLREVPPLEKELVAIRSRLDRLEAAGEMM